MTFGFEPLSYASTASLDRPMILLNQVIATFVRPHFDIPPAQLFTSHQANFVIRPTLERMRRRGLLQFQHLVPLVSQGGAARDMCVAAYDVG